MSSVVKMIVVDSDPTVYFVKKLINNLFKWRKHMNMGHFLSEIYSLLTVNQREMWSKCFKLAFFDYVPANTWSDPDPQQ